MHTQTEFKLSHELEGSQESAGFLRRLPGTVYFRPLALALAMLMLIPPASWVSGMQSPATQAQAQQLVTGACQPGPTRILNHCGASVGAGINQIDADLERFEKDTVEAYMTLHQMPASDAGLIYQYGKRGLRSEIRALMLTRMMGIIVKNAADRSTHEAYMYRWFQNKIWNYEKQLYQSAVNERDNWGRDACAWSPDADVAAAYSLTYNKSQFCDQFTQQVSGFTLGGPVPSRDYFLTAALKNTYGKAVYSAVDGNAILAETSRRSLIHAGITVGSTLVGGAIAGGIIAVGATTFFTFTSGGIAGTASGILATGIGVAGAAAGTALIAVIAVVVGVLAGIRVAEKEETMNGLKVLDSLNAAVQMTAPDLGAFSNDKLGQTKLVLAFTAETLPDFESLESPATLRSANEFFVITPEGGQPVETDTARIRDWDGGNWTLNLYTGWFVQKSIPTTTVAPSELLSPTISFVDWAGKKYWASRMGANFLVVKETSDANDIKCNANPITGVSQPADPSKCSSLMAASLNLLDNNGNKVSLRVGAPPTFTSDNYGSFVSGQSKTVTITAFGYPAPTITRIYGNEPAGFVTTSGSNVMGQGRAAVMYNGKATTSHFGIGFRASNASGFTDVYFTYDIGSALQFNSPTTATFTAGIPGSFTVSTTGSGPVRLALSGPVPDGLTFRDNGNGTATLSGTAKISTTYFCTGPCNTVTASNPVSSAQQNLFIKVNQPPRPTISSAASVTFNAGVDNSFTITTAGAKVPVAIGVYERKTGTQQAMFGIPGGTVELCVPQTLPWLKVVDNQDGTATVSGKPTGAATSYPLTIVLASYGVPELPVCTTPNFTVNVSANPVFTSKSTFAFKKNTAVPLSVDAVNATGDVSVIGALPPGVTMIPRAPGFATFTTPAVAGGAYPVTFTVPGAGGKTASQMATFHVIEPPVLEVANVITFKAQVANIFNITPGGYPVLPLPAGVLGSEASSGMRVKVAGTLPQGVTFSDVSAAGNPTGVGVLSGTPAPNSGGSYSLTITADNGYGVAVKNVVLLVIR